MGKLYTAEYTICSIDGIYSSKKEAQELQRKIDKLDNDVEITQTLSGYSLKEIMAAYQFGGLKDVYHLLPASYRNDQELAFIACLNGDDISTRSSNLKRSYTLSCYLAHHILRSFKYIHKEHLVRNDSYILNEFTENHLDALNVISTEYITKDMVLNAIKNYYANQYRTYGEIAEPEHLILSHIPEELKSDFEIIAKVSKINPILLFDMDPKCVAHSLSYNELAFSQYMKYLTKRSSNIEKKLQLCMWPGKQNLTDVEKIKLRTELRDILHRQSLLYQAKERAINKEINVDIRRRNREITKNKK